MKKVYSGRSEHIQEQNSTKRYVFPWGHKESDMTEGLSAHTHLVQTEDTPKQTQAQKTTDPLGTWSPQGDRLAKVYFGIPALFFGQCNYFQSCVNNQRIRLLEPKCFFLDKRELM